MKIVEVEVAPLSQGKPFLDTVRDLALNSDGLIIPEPTTTAVKIAILDGYGFDICEGAFTLPCLGHLVNLNERFGIPPGQVLGNYQEQREVLAGLVPAPHAPVKISLAAFLEAGLASLIRQRGEAEDVDNPHKALMRTGWTGYSNKLAPFSWNILNPGEWREMLVQISVMGINQLLTGVLEPDFQKNPNRTFLISRFSPYDVLKPVVVSNGRQSGI